MSAGIDGDAAMKILRLEEELAIHAVARTQNGTVVDDVEFDWEVGTDADTVDDNPSDDTMSNMVTAEVAGKTTITVTAIDQNVAAEIDIEVTAKADNVTLKAMGDDDAFEADESYFPNDVIAAKLEAIPDVKHRAGSDVKWTGSGAVKVEVLEDDNPNKRYAKITAKSAGTGKVTAMYEGKEASFDVTVSGPSRSRMLTYDISDGGTFTYDRGPVAANNVWTPATITLEAVLVDNNGDPLVGRNVVATLTNGNTTANKNPTFQAGTSPQTVATVAGGIAQFVIAAPSEAALANLAATDGAAHTITLSSLGAPSVKVKLVTIMKNP